MNAAIGKSRGRGPARQGRASLALLSRRLAPWALLVPSGLFLGLMVAASLMMLRISFGAKNAEYDVWILGNYVKLTDTLYWKSIVVTLKLAFFSAVLVVVLGFPIAMFMARVRTEALRRIVLFAILLPLLMNLLLQSFGWLVLLAPTGLFNQILRSLGIADGPVLLIFNQTGVLLALVQTAIPLAVLPMAGAIRMIPESVEEAAATLGANRLQVLWHVVLPLSLPGIIAASLLVFAFNASAFVVPLLLGGLRVWMVALLIRDLMGPQLNWPLGAAAAMVLVVLTLGVLAVYQKLMARYA